MDGTLQAHLYWPAPIGESSCCDTAHIPYSQTSANKQRLQLELHPQNITNQSRLFVASSERIFKYAPQCSICVV